MALVNDSLQEEVENTDDGIEEPAYYSFQPQSPARPHSENDTPRAIKPKTSPKGKGKGRSKGSKSDESVGMVTPFKGDSHYLSSSSSEDM